MNATVLDWAGKAEGDYRTAMRELRARTHRNLDAACFHFQQYAEKTFKAVIISQGVLAPHTHDLVQLAALLPPPVLGLPPWTDTDLAFLTRAAVAMRYPGESADMEDARRCRAICEVVRTALLPLL